MHFVDVSENFLTDFSREGGSLGMWHEGVSLAPTIKLKRKANISLTALRSGEETSSKNAAKLLYTQIKFSISKYSISTL